MSVANSMCNVTKNGNEGQCPRGISGGQSDAGNWILGIFKVTNQDTFKLRYDPKFVKNKPV